MTNQSKNAALVAEIIDVIVSAVNLHHIDKSKVHSDTALMKNGLDLDSVDILEVVVAIESHFGVKVQGADAGRKHFQTIGSIAQFVEQART